MAVNLDDSSKLRIYRSSANSFSYKMTKLGNLSYVFETWRVVSPLRAGQVGFCEMGSGRIWIGRDDGLADRIVVFYPTGDTS
jgi:hypothetical protein